LAKIDDITNLEQLINISVRSLSVGYYTNRQIESALAYVFGIDSQLITDETYYVVETENAIVGCGGWSKRKTLFGGDNAEVERADSFLNPETDAAKIRAFFVHPDWTRKGIAKRIISFCEESAKNEGFKQMELASTLPGEPLYAALGYRVKVRFDYRLQDGVIMPLIQMTKQIA